MKYWNFYDKFNKLIIFIIQNIQNFTFFHFIWENLNESGDLDFGNKTKGKKTRFNNITN